MEKGKEITMLSLDSVDIGKTGMCTDAGYSGKLRNVSQIGYRCTIEHNGLKIFYRN